MKPHNYSLNFKKLRLPRDKNSVETPCLTELVALLACWRTQGVDCNVCASLVASLTNCRGSINVRLTFHKWHIYLS